MCKGIDYKFCVWENKSDDKAHTGLHVEGRSNKQPKRRLLQSVVIKKKKLEVKT